MKKTKNIIAPVSMPRPLFKAVKEKARKRYGPRQFSRHVRNVLTEDLRE